MPAWLNRIQKQLDKLSNRDRIAVYITTAAMILLLWDLLLFNPLGNQLNKLEQDASVLDQQLSDADKQILTIQSNMQADPDIAGQTLMAEYAAEKLRLDQALAKSAVMVISPQEMASLLEKILKAQTQLKFISLQNIAAVPQTLSANLGTQSTDANTGIIFRHSVILKMEGSYHDTLAYLQKLEQLPWHFSWKSIDIETRDYPTMTITLEVYTFSLKRGLIGA